jgi:hypothetical protein
MRAVHRAVSGYLSRHSQEHAGAVLGIDQSSISRHNASVLDGVTTHAQRWNAGHLAAMAEDDAIVMGELIALRAKGGVHPEILSTLRDLLAAAASTTEVLSPQSPAGQGLSRSERDRLIADYTVLIDHRAQALAALRQERP